MSVAIAYDGDEAGQKAMTEIMVKLLSTSMSETTFVRGLLIHRSPHRDCIKSLSNWELADEMSFWEHCRKIGAAPDWWYEMAEEHKADCLSEITRRSKQINDLDGIDYIRVYNEENTITDVLIQYGIEAIPGRTIHCPMHDDSTPSLTIFAHNRRAFCFNQACLLNGDGHGESAFGLNKLLSK